MAKGHRAATSANAGALDRRGDDETMTGRGGEGRPVTCSITTVGSPARRRGQVSAGGEHQPGSDPGDQRGDRKSAWADMNYQ